jgi:3-hydroxyisobutyrate dehydrogenase
MKKRIIGINGLGKMGMAVAKRLLEIGESIAVHTRSKERYDRFKRSDVTWCDSPQALTNQCDFIINFLFDDLSVEHSFFSKSGYLTADLNNMHIIEMTTIKPVTANKIALAVKSKGGIFIESPVSGTVGPARKGQLMALVGAEPADLESSKEVLGLLTRKIIHAGPVGQGSLLKLVINLPLAIYWQSIKEAYELAKLHNMDIDLVIEALAESGACAKVLNHKIESILGRSNDCGFDITTMIKDIDCIQTLYEGQPRELEALNAAMDSYRALSDRGLGDLDACRIINPPKQ